MTSIQSVSGIGPHLVTLLEKKGISTAEQLAAASPTALLDVSGIGPRRVETLLRAARAAIEAPAAKAVASRKTPAGTCQRL